MQQEGEREGERERGMMEEAERTAMDDESIAKSVPRLEPMQDKERLEAHIEFCTSGEFFKTLY